MNKMFEKGKTVRLNERGLKWQTMTAGKPVRHHKVIWEGRTGIVTRITNCGEKAGVIWEGNFTNSDPLPLKFLELV